MTALKYLQAYPAALQEQVRQLIAKDQLGAYLEQRYPEHVLRIHRSCLVNPAFLQRLEFAEPGGWYLRLHGIAQPLPVSRRQVAVVRKTLTICKK